MFQIMTSPSSSETPNSIRAKQKPCRDCQRLIPAAAARCSPNGGCGAFQDWRRFVGEDVSLVGILTLVGVMVALVLNGFQIRSLASVASKEDVKEITQLLGEEIPIPRDDQLRIEISKALELGQIDRALGFLDSVRVDDVKNEECEFIFSYSVRNGRLDQATDTANRCFAGTRKEAAFSEIANEKLKQP